jgi:ribosomal protein S6--L-glutamate ligase
MGRPLTVSADLRELAAGCAGRLGLRLAGIDVLESPDGPVVVDVEAFPDYAGVPEAGEVVAAAVVARLAVSARRCER